ncbi:MAG TPA: GNAT family N-acetyltransferase [Streptosporangiaceae bacterium]|nr:GNAT family N-acetyltransferase [Streptosporangiaceae bacterium]
MPVPLPRRPMPGRLRNNDNVIPADRADAGRLSQVIADAFFDLPQSRWLIPDEAARRDILPGYFQIYVDHALDAGIAHTTTGRTAVALWLPAGQHGPAQPAGYTERLAAATSPWTGAFLAFDDTLDAHHPAGAAHHHLAVLAVQPGHQGEGIGSALLRAYHQVIDRGAGAPAYLEAAAPRSRDLYRRHGYVMRPASPFYLPDGPAMWPMWREPRPGPAAAS